MRRWSGRRDEVVRWSGKRDEMEVNGALQRVFWRCSRCPHRRNTGHMRHLDGPVDAGKSPGQAQSQKDVDGVAASDVANGVVSSLFHRGGLLAGKKIRQGSAQSNEGDGSDRVLQAHQASEDGSQVSHDGRQHADDDERDAEGEPALPDAGRRDECEEDLRGGVASSVTELPSSCQSFSSHPMKPTKKYQQQ